MANDSLSDADRSSSSVESNPSSTLAASTTYKVLGEFSESQGAGVLGKNTAGSGTPIGVEGAVSNTSGGYGLSTPNDANVGGVLETGGLAGSVTGGQTVTDLRGVGLSVANGSLSAATLPRYDEVGDYPRPTADAIGRTFSPLNWGNSNFGYTSNDTDGGAGDNAFRGAVLAPTGEIIFAPGSSDNVGIYDPFERTYTSGPSHFESDRAFGGAALTQTAEIILQTSDQQNIGTVTARGSMDLETALHPMVNGT